jgi:ribosomal protein S18 acetylase RimI-like enzyme
MPILPADKEDIPALVTLLNSAYRGEVSKKGWTTEADLLRGELRTDEATLNKLMNLPGARFLKFINEKNEIQGCVFLQKKENKIYLGMLSVSPLIQAKGIGKQLMVAGEMFAKEQACHSIFMKVISLRHELIAWYERQGYKRTRQTEPFPLDTRFGIPTQPLEFIILEKTF